MIDTPFAAAGASPQAGHIGFRTRFIEEDELIDGQRALFFFPPLAGSGYIGSLLFARAQRFFL